MIPELFRIARKKWLTLPLLLIVVCFNLAACEVIDPEREALTANTRLELVDWHISGLWVINSPVAWIRVTNFNPVPIHDITLEYKSFTAEGKPLETGTFTIEGTVPPGQSKNFIELYLGLVDLYTEKLSIKLLSVKKADH